MCLRTPPGGIASRSSGGTDHTLPTTPGAREQARNNSNPRDSTTSPFCPVIVGVDGRCRGGEAVSARPGQKAVESRINLFLDKKRTKEGQLERAGRKSSRFRRPECTRGESRTPASLRGCGSATARRTLCGGKDVSEQITSP